MVIKPEITWPHCFVTAILAAPVAIIIPGPHGSLSGKRRQPQIGGAGIYKLQERRGGVLAAGEGDRQVGKGCGQAQTMEYKQAGGSMSDQPTDRLLLVRCVHHDFLYSDYGKGSTVHLLILLGAQENSVSIKSYLTK